MYKINTHYIRGVIKVTSYSIFAFFSVILVHMSVVYVDNISHFGLPVRLLTDKKVRRVLVCFSSF